MIISEHKINELQDCTYLTKDKYECFFPKKRVDQLCFSIWKENNVYKLCTGYFIGIDWIEKNIRHIQVAPKINFYEDGVTILEVDYLKMLINSLKHNETAKLISDLVIVKWDDPQIEIEQKDDMLTPFILIDFLNVVKTIVKKGLKKSYYKTSKTLNGRIKGKILMKQTMNMHLTKGNLLHNVCSYDEFGENINENKLLKKALEFIKQYMDTSPLMKEAYTVSDILSYISPAFERVSSNIEVNEIKRMKSNTFFKEYDKGIRLGKMILKRFAYNISNTSNKKILTPPFWIDMPLLFELHVLSLLKDSFKSNIDYHISTYGNELDFILKSAGFRMVIDAKYIPRWKWEVVHENVRQISGYARLKKVYQYLDKKYPESNDCLIIYPDIDNGILTIEMDSFSDDIIPIEAYHGVYKLGVKIPVII